MSLEVKIEKRYVFFFLGIVLLIGGIFVTTAYGTTNPPAFGHTASEIDPGVFGGAIGDAWRFPGQVHFGGASDVSRGFYVGTTNTGARALLLSNGTYPTGAVDVAIFPEDKHLGIWTQNPRAETHIRQDGYNALRLSSSTLGNSALQLYNNDASAGYWGWTVLELGTSGDFQINYDQNENVGVSRLILKRDGAVLFPSLAGSGNVQLCVHADGSLYRGTPSC